MTYWCMTLYSSSAQLFPSKPERCLSKFAVKQSTAKPNRSITWNYFGSCYVQPNQSLPVTFLLGQHLFKRRCDNPPYQPSKKLEWIPGRPLLLMATLCATSVNTSKEFLMRKSPVRKFPLQHLSFTSLVRACAHWLVTISETLLLSHMLGKLLTMLLESSGNTL
jgi:hypothetical protein